MRVIGPGYARPSPEHDGSDGSGSSPYRSIPTSTAGTYLSSSASISSSTRVRVIGVAEGFADPPGSVEVGEHQDLAEFGASGGRKAGTGRERNHCDVISPVSGGASR